MTRVSWGFTEFPITESHLAERHLLECQFADQHFAKCHFSESLFARCYFADSMSIRQTAFRRMSLHRNPNVIPPKSVGSRSFCPGSSNGVSDAPRTLYLIGERQTPDPINSAPSSPWFSRLWRSLGSLVIWCPDDSPNVISPNVSSPTQCHFANCHFAECQFAEYQFAHVNLLNVISPNGVLETQGIGAAIRWIDIRQNDNE